MATKLYLTNLTPTYTPTTWKGLWDETDESVSRQLETQKSRGGAHTSKTATETSTSNTYSAAIYRGISAPLSAQTISGTFNVRCGIDVSSTAADMCWHAHVYVTQGDTDAVRGTLLSDYLESLPNEWPATDAVKEFFAGAQTVSDVSAQVGDRIVVELGYIARNSVATSYTGKVWYGTQDDTTFAELNDATLDTNPSTTPQAHHVEFSATLGWATTIEMRVPQSALETLLTDPGTVRVAQSTVEVMQQPTGVVRVPQSVIEVLQSVTTPSPPSHTNPARVSQATTEAIIRGDAKARIAQHAIEVLVGPQAVKAYVSQFARELILRRPTPGATVSQFVLEFVGPLELYYEEEFEPGQSFGPLIWVEVAGPDAVTRGYAPVDLPDPSSYYRGWKPAEMITAGRMARALSDEQGQYEAMRFNVTLSDMASRQWRAWLGSVSTRQLLNRLVVARMISVDAWRAKLRPRTVAVGYIRDYRLE